MEFAKSNPTQTACQQGWDCASGPCGSIKEDRHLDTIARSTVIEGLVFGERSGMRESTDGSPCPRFLLEPNVLLSQPRNHPHTLECGEAGQREAQTSACCSKRAREHLPLPGCLAVSRLLRTVASKPDPLPASSRRRAVWPRLQLGMGEGCRVEGVC